jgi:hypothetical protein
VSPKLLNDQNLKVVDALMVVGQFADGAATITDLRRIFLGSGARFKV